MNILRISVLLFSILSFFVNFLYASNSDTSYYVYVSLKGDNAIAIYSLNSQNGALSLIDQQIVSGGPASLATDPLRKFLFVAQRNSNSISSFRINASNGRLTLIKTIAAVNNPVYIATDKTGKYLLTAYFNANKTAIYSIDSTGVLNNTPTQIIETGHNPHAIQTDPTNKYLYISNKTGNQIQQYQFNEKSGTITTLTPPSIEPPLNTGPRHFIFNKSSNIVYFINETGSSMSSYNVTNTGSLSLKQTISSIPSAYTGTNTSADIHITTNNKYIYASNRGNESIVACSISDNTGEITILDFYKSPKTPREIEIDPSGNFLFAAGEADNRLTTWRIVQNSGKLDSLNTFTVGKTPSWILCIPISKPDFFSY